MSINDIFSPYTFGQTQREQMDRDGHYIFPGLLTKNAQRRLTRALQYIQSLRTTEKEGHEPRKYSAEYDDYLASLIGHPQMLALARAILGLDIRWDHCVTLNRLAANKGQKWHAHGYGEEDMNRGLGFIRIFFYVNGFSPDDGGLKVVPGSHLYKDRDIKAETDSELLNGWMKGKTHPQTAQPLAIETLSVPPGTVITMWTHTLHGVNAKSCADTRWAVVYAYRNPGLPSRARWVTEEFEKRGVSGAEGLLSLY